MDYYLSSPWLTLLAVGPALLDELHAYPALTSLSAFVKEPYVWETLFLDEAQHALFWWGCLSDWDHPPSSTQQLWKGWQWILHSEGARYHLRLSGRSLEDIRCPTEQLYELLLDFFRLRELESYLLRAMQQLLQGEHTEHVPASLLSDYPSDLPLETLQTLYALARRGLS